VVMDPQHDYTKKLIASVPVPDPKEEMKRRELRRRLRREAAEAAA
jgi:oligopeptide transport system ATP-binding protein